MPEDCPHCGHEDLSCFDGGEHGLVLPFHPKPDAKGRPGGQLHCPAGGKPLEVVAP